MKTEIYTTLVEKEINGSYYYDYRFKRMDCETGKDKDLIGGENLGKLFFSEDQEENLRFILRVINQKNPVYRGQNFIEYCHNLHKTTDIDFETPLTQDDVQQDIILCFFENLEEIRERVEKNENLDAVLRFIHNEIRKKYFNKSEFGMRRATKEETIKAISEAKTRLMFGLQRLFENPSKDKLMAFTKGLVELNVTTIDELEEVLDFLEAERYSERGYFDDKKEQFIKEHCEEKSFSTARRGIKRRLEKIIEKCDEKTINDFLEHSPYLMEDRVKVVATGYCIGREIQEID